jgi:hypothetical protein
MRRPGAMALQMREVSMQRLKSPMPVRVQKDVLAFSAEHSSWVLQSPTGIRTSRLDDK